MKKKTLKEVKMHTFFVCACKSQEFAPHQKSLARSQDRETVTFRNCEMGPNRQVQIYGSKKMG